MGVFFILSRDEWYGRTRFRLGKFLGSETMQFVGYSLILGAWRFG